MPHEDVFGDLDFGADEPLHIVGQRPPRVSVNTKRRFKVTLKAAAISLLETSLLTREFEGPYRYYISGQGVLTIHDMDKITGDDTVVAFANGQWVSIEPIPCQNQG